MIKRFNESISILMVCLASLVLVGCSSGNDDKKVNNTPPPPAVLKNNRLTVAVNTTIKSAAIILAYELGYFEKEGVDVELILKQSGVATKKAFDDGLVDIATVPEIIAANDSLVNDSWKIISSINRSVTNELIARKDRGIHQISDLRGKKIGVKMGSGGAYWLNQMLIYSSIPMAEVELIDLQPVSLASMLTKGSVDAIVTWYPHAYYAIEDLGENAYHTSAQMGQEVYWLLIAHKKWLAENPELAIRFLKAIDKSNRYIENNPAKAKDLLAEFLHLDSSSISFEWDLHIFKNELPQNLLMVMEEEVLFTLAKQGQGSLPDFHDLIYFDAMQKTNSLFISIAH